MGIHAELPPVGTRVSLRYRLPAGSVPPLTDVVGHLLDVAPKIRVRTEVRCGGGCLTGGCGRGARAQRRARADVADPQRRARGGAGVAWARATVVGRLVATVQRRAQSPREFRSAACSSRRLDRAARDRGLVRRAGRDAVARCARPAGAPTRHRRGRTRIPGDDNRVGPDGRLYRSGVAAPRRAVDADLRTRRRRRRAHRGARRRGGLRHRRPTSPSVASPSPRHPTGRGGRDWPPSGSPSTSVGRGRPARCVRLCCRGPRTGARPAPTSRCCRTTSRRQGSTSRWASPPSIGSGTSTAVRSSPCGWPPGTSTRSAPASIASRTGWSAPTSTCWPCRRPSAPTRSSPPCRSPHSATTSRTSGSTSGTASPSRRASDSRT